MAISLGKLLPGSLRSRIASAMRERMIAGLREESNAIPKVGLRPEHVANARLLVDRAQLLALLPANAVVAELGVDKGDFSQRILDTCHPQRLHLIDAWSSERYGQAKRRAVQERFADQVREGTVVIDIGYTTEVVSRYPDGYFDWIYIDSAHTYTVTRDELALYRPKMKPGGVIAGHDYIIGNWNGLLRYGVIEAVHEFCVAHGWELRYVTTELDDHPSFAIRMIGG